MSAATHPSRTRPRQPGEPWRASVPASRSAGPAARRSLARQGASRRGSLVCQVLACLFALALPLEAVDPGTAIKTAAVAKDSVPGLVRAGKGIVEIPWQVAQCLRLPLGLVEMVFSPLPGIEFADGLRDTGQGLVAPFKLCIATLTMPYEVFGGVGQAAASLVE